MLAKVLKYDLKATGRLLVPAYLVFIVISVVNKICLEIGLRNEYESVSLQLAQGLTFILYLLTVFVIGILTTVFVVMYFYKSMAGEQGYLTHTLPTQTEVLIISKIICSLIWQLVVTILISSSVFFMLFGHIGEIYTSLGDIFGFTWQKMLSSLDFDINIYSILLVTASAVSAIMSSVTYLACIAFGNLSNKHKVMSAIFSYVGFYIGLRIFRLIINIIYEITKSEIGSSVAAEMLNGKLIFDIMVNIVITVVLYLLTVDIFKKRLNLE